MEELKIQGTSQYPTITLNHETGNFEFFGNSLPEDAKAFYQPILDWLDKYIESPHSQTRVTFKMVYYNTPSSKMLYQIFKKLEQLSHKGNDISVVWMYNEDDIDIKEAGKDFAENMQVPVNLVPYKD